MKNKKIYKIVITILVGIIIAGGWYLDRTIDNLNNIKESYNYDKNYLMWKLRNDVRSMDNELAKVLVAIDDASRFDALLSSLKYSNANNRSMDNVMLMNRKYNPIFSQVEGYLDYLVRENKELSDIERGNIKLIREHLAIIVPSYERVIELIEEKKLDRGFYNDVDVVKVIDKMVDNLEKLPNIGDDDGDFKNYSNRYTGYYPRDLFKDEKEYSKEELEETAKRFMGELWEDLDVDSSGEGMNPEFGEYVTFVGNKNGKLFGSYVVNLSKLGGHIVGSTSVSDYNEDEDKILGEMTKEESISYTEKLIKRWGEEELVLYDTREIEEDNNKLFLTFVPLRNDIPLVNRSVEIVINTRLGKLLSFNPYSYFINYNRVPPLEAKLSEEEVINILKDKFEIDGRPTLEVVSGKSSSDVLVYRVPVKGVENIEYIYLNAITGSNEGVKHEKSY